MIGVIPVKEPEKSNRLLGFSVFSFVALEAPADGVTFSGSALFTLLALSDGFEGATAAHFFEDAFAIKHRLETFQSAVYWLVLLDFNASHEINRLLSYGGFVCGFRKGQRG